jgi:predicted molibdopterin-dependent oxidoreductase YjgC
VRALAESAETVIGIGMFEGTFRGWCDLVLPGTSYLERDGTTVNLEGRLQRQRRAVIAPCPDELAWIAKLAERFGVELSPHASLVFDEVSARCYGGISFADVGERAPLPARVESTAPVATPPSNKLLQAPGLRLVTYRPLFSGAAVERTPELEFMRPTGQIALAPDDARARGIRDGDMVTVASNGTSRELLARIARDLTPGMARIPLGDAAGLHDFVEVTA